MEERDRPPTRRDARPIDDRRAPSGGNTEVSPAVVVKVQERGEIAMADAQARVQALIDDFVGRDIERGLQVAAYHNGELVVDAWAGVADARDGRKVDGDT